MAISRKPSTEESKIKSVIERGGKTVVSDDSGQAQKVTLQLRLNKTTIDKIDELLSHRPVRVPRHTWFLEAIVEKISREQKEQ